MARRRRDLVEEERALWGQVAKTVTPLDETLPRRRPKPVAAEPVSEPDHNDAPVSAPAPEAAKKHPPKFVKVKHPAPETPEPAPKPKRPAIQPLVPIDQRTRRKILRGSVAVEARIDLHGMTQAEAFPALRGFLARTQMAGGRLVIVITGKGQRGGGDLVFEPGERGILRRLVPQWLTLPDFRDLVAGFEEAGPPHGGAGALYVRLRKPKAIKRT